MAGSDPSCVCSKRSAMGDPTTRRRGIGDHAGRQKLVVGNTNVMSDLGAQLPLLSHFTRPTSIDLARFEAPSARRQQCAPDRHRDPGTARDRRPLRPLHRLHRRGAGHRGGAGAGVGGDGPVALDYFSSIVSHSFSGAMSSVLIHLIDLSTRPSCLL